MYWSWAELGREALNHSSMWYYVSVIRSSEVDNIVGGFGHVFCRSIATFVPCMSEQGVVVDLGDGSSLLMFSKVVHFIGDVKEIQGSWSFKGPGGTRCCFACRNVITMRDKDGNRVLPTGSYCVDIGHTDTSDFDPTSDEHWYDIADHLLAKATTSATKKEFADLQQAVGLTFNTHSILHQAQLRRLVPPSTIIYDLVHVFVVVGVAHFEFTNSLHSAKKKLGLKWGRVYEFFQHWSWPRWRNSRGNLASVWGPKQESSCHDNFSVELRNCLTSTKSSKSSCSR